jgi:hypothetical protein
MTQIVNRDTRKMANVTSRDLTDVGDTDSAGIASITWDTDGWARGQYYPKCNISHEPTLYYNKSASFEDNTSYNLTAGNITAWFEVGLILPPDGLKVGQNRTLGIAIKKPRVESILRSGCDGLLVASVLALDRGQNLLVMCP